MSRISACMGPPGARFPRVSGDEPGGNPAVENYLTFSPRERG